MTTVTPIRPATIWNPGTGGGYVPPNGNPGTIPPWLRAFTDDDPDSPLLPLPGPVLPWEPEV